MHPVLRIRCTKNVSDYAKIYNRKGAFFAPQSIRFTFVVIHNVNDFVVFF